MKTEDLLFWIDIENKLTSYGVCIEDSRYLVRIICEHMEKQRQEISGMKDMICELDYYADMIDQIRSIVG